MSSDNIKNLKNKKIVIVLGGMIALGIVALYAWVGSYVMRVFPRQDSKTPTAFSSPESGKAVSNGHEASKPLGSMPEKDIPSSTAVQSATTPRQEQANNHNAQSHGRSAEHSKKSLIELRNIRF